MRLEVFDLIKRFLFCLGEGGVVKIWDIRFLKGPAARIDGHYGVVNSICWSTTHCDILTTGATDRSWKAWALGSSNLSARYPIADAFVDCPGSEWEESLPSSHRDSRVSFGGKLLAEYQADLSGPIASSNIYNSYCFDVVSICKYISCRLFLLCVYYGRCLLSYVKR